MPAPFYTIMVPTLYRFRKEKSGSFFTRNFHTHIVYYYSTIFQKDTVPFELIAMFPYAASFNAVPSER